MENFKKIALVSIVSFLGLSAIGATLAGITENPQDPLSLLHQEEVACENDTKENLSIQKRLQESLSAVEAELETARSCREEIASEKIRYMNTAEAGEFEITYKFGEKLEEYIEEMPEDTFVISKDEHLEQACNKWAKDPSYCVKVMTGVFVADSSWATKGAGATNLNPGNLRPGSGKYGDPDVQWVSNPSPGNGYFRKYTTLRDGIYDNVALYAQLYEGKSLDYMRRVWAGGSFNWLKIVTSYVQ